MKKKNKKQKKQLQCVNPGRLGGLPITQPGGSRLEEIRLASISNPFEMGV
jgi:hypothetical protein